MLKLADVQFTAAASAATVARALTTGMMTIITTRMRGGSG